MVLLTLLTATLLCLPNIALAQLPNGACSIEEASCEIQEDNLLGILSGISSAEECRQACENNSTTCQYFSYYGETSFPFIETCLLFDSCPVLNPCTDCLTEELDCFDAFCEAPVEGSLGDNLIQVLGNIDLSHLIYFCIHDWIESNSLDSGWRITNNNERSCSRIV